jgi:hypothetical protein
MREGRREKRDDEGEEEAEEVDSGEEGYTLLL